MKYGLILTRSDIKGQIASAVRAEAAGFLIDEGIKTQSALFDRVRQKLAEIERLRAELRGMIADKTI